MGFVVSDLCLLREDAAQRRHNLRDVFDGLRWIVHTGAPWLEFRTPSGPIPQPAASVRN